MARVPLAGLSKGSRALDAKTAHYLGSVLRLRPGQAFVVFDAETRVEADATLLESHGEVRCAIGEVRAATTVIGTGIVLVQALAKGDKVEQVVRSATALGVSELHLVESNRSVTRVTDRAERKHARLLDIALDAARQCGRGDVPPIVGPHPIEQEFEDWRSVSALKLCFVPRAPRSMRFLTRDWKVGSKIALLIGPEGGLSEGEIAAAETVGFHRAAFGELVLRTEVASVAVLGALQLLSQS